MSLFASISSISKVNTTTSTTNNNVNKLTNNTQFSGNKVNLLDHLVSGLLLDLAVVTEKIGL